MLNTFNNSDSYAHSLDGAGTTNELELATLQLHLMDMFPGKDMNMVEVWDALQLLQTS